MFQLRKRGLVEDVWTRRAIPVLSAQRIFLLTIGTDLRGGRVGSIHLFTYRLLHENLSIQQLWSTMYTECGLFSTFAIVIERIAAKISV
jgi:hypothetical protein